MADKDDNQATNEVSKSTCEVQRELEAVKTEESEFESIINASKRKKKDSEDSHGTIGLWRGNAVGPEAKELLEAVEHHYPNTYQGVQIRSDSIRLAILKELYAAIKSFMGKSVCALEKEQLTGLQADFEEFEKFGFDLSWARKRLDMVDRLKFGNEPLQQEFMALEDFLEPLKEMVARRLRQIMEAHDMWKTAQREYDDAKCLRDNKIQEVEHKFGADFDRVLKGRLGLGMLPGY